MQWQKLFAGPMRVRLSHHPTKPISQDHHHAEAVCLFVIQIRFAVPLQYFAVTKPARSHEKCFLPGNKVSMTANARAHFEQKIPEEIAINLVFINRTKFFKMHPEIN